MTTVTQSKLAAESYEPEYRDDDYLGAFRVAVFPGGVLTVYSYDVRGYIVPSADFMRALARALGRTSFTVPNYGTGEGTVYTFA